jgi:hypothetical protein
MMAKQTVGLTKTFGADTAIASANVCVVMSGTNAGNVALPAGAFSVKFGGVVQEPAQTGAATNQVTVALSGVVQVASDGNGAINAGDYLAIGNTSGQVRTIVPSTGTNQRQVIGIALSSAAATAGLLVDMLIQPMVYIGA